MKGLNPLDLLLFVRGCGARSLDAIRAVRAACDLAEAGPRSLRVIDVFNEPALVQQYRVIATPTLVTVGGEHERRLVGELSVQTVCDHFELGLSTGAVSHGH